VDFRVLPWLSSSCFSPLTFHFFVVKKAGTDRYLQPEHAAAFERVAEQFVAGKNPDLEMLQSARTA
jgi:hypothetical protein